jgi:hypothetical protein
MEPKAVRPHVTRTQSRFLAPTVVVVALTVSGSASAHLFPARDLENLATDATTVVRAEVVEASGGDAEGDPVRLKLRVLAALKGEPPELVIARGDAHHALRPDPGEQGIFFLGPSSKAPDETACLQSASERLPVDGESAKDADAFIRGLGSLMPSATAGERTAVYLVGLDSSVVRLSTYAAQRLAGLAAQGGLGDPEWDRIEGVVADEVAPMHARSGLVAAVGALMPGDRLLRLSRDVKSPPVRALLLPIAGERAARDSELRPDVLEVLRAARVSEAPHVALGAAAGLCALGVEEALPVLAAALATNDASRRDLAAVGLARLARTGSAEARARLLALTHDRDPLIKLRAMQGLESLREVHSTSASHAWPRERMLLLGAGGVGAVWVVLRRRSRGLAAREPEKGRLPLARRRR